MEKQAKVEVRSLSAEDTEALAATIGSRLKGGEMIELVSDVGGGKTTFVRGLARGAGSADGVASPTFTISRVYAAGQLTIYHYDFYRLQDAGLVALELEESIHNPNAVTVVEWSDIVAGVLPAERLRVEIRTVGDSERMLTFAFPDKLKTLVEGL